MDIVSLTPLDILYLKFGKELVLLRLPRLLKVTGLERRGVGVVRRGSALRRSPLTELRSGASGMAGCMAGRLAGQVARRHGTARHGASGSHAARHPTRCLTQRPLRGGGTLRKG